MQYRVFNVGDRVRIRDWDDMAAEFGTNGYGDINCHLVFVDSMRDLCGLETKITGINDRDDNEYLFYDETIGNWRISGDMLELVDEPEPEIEELVSPGNPFTGLF